VQTGALVGQEHPLPLPPQDALRSKTISPFPPLIPLFHESLMSAKSSSALRLQGPPWRVAESPACLRLMKHKPGISRHACLAEMSNIMPVLCYSSAE